MRRPLILATTLLLALPAGAGAAVTLEEFTVTPSSLQAGSHPNVVIFQRIAPTGGDDVKDTFVRLVPGLLGNPQSAALCTSQQLRSPAGCPAESKVGTVQVVATVHLLAPSVSEDQTIDGTVYNLRPTGPEPARLGLKLEPKVLPSPFPSGLEAVYLESPVFLRPGADGIGLESAFADQPRASGGLDTQIKSVRLTFLGKTSRGNFMRMPTACAEGRSLGRVNSWDAPAVFSEKSHVFTPTGCESLPFLPQVEGSLGAPGAINRTDSPPLTTTLRFDPEGAALKLAEVVLPRGLTPILASVNRACPKAQAAANTCPESSRVGTAIIDSPLQPDLVRGPVYLAFNTDDALPGLIVNLPAPVDLRIDATTQLGDFGTKNVFPSNPDLPLRTFTLAFGPGLLVLGSDLCDPKTDTVLTGTLTSHSGKSLTFAKELATPGCDPRAKLRLIERRGGVTLKGVLQAARRGPDITSIRVTLPKQLRRGTRPASLRVDGQKARLKGAPRSLKLNTGSGARRVRVLWRGLAKRGRKLPGKLALRVRMMDERGKLTSLRLRVPVE